MVELDLYFRYFKYLMKDSDIKKLYNESKEYTITDAQMDEFCIKHICKAVEIIDISVLSDRYTKEEKRQKISWYVS